MGKTLQDRLAFTKMIADMEGIDMIVLQGPQNTSRERPTVILFYPHKDYSDTTVTEDVNKLVSFFNRGMSAKMAHELARRLAKDWGWLGKEEK